MNPFAISIAAIVVAMISIQSGASFAKQLFPSVGADGVTVLRLSFATLILWAILRPWRGKLDRSALKMVLFYGASLGVMNLLFYRALERIPLGIAVALEFTGPLAIALFGSRRLLDFLWAVLAIVGVGLLLPIAPTAQAMSWQGVAYALGAGICWAFYILFGQRAGRAVGGPRAAALGMLVATLVVFICAATSISPALVADGVLPRALLVAVLSSALPYSLEMVALRRLPSNTFGILMSLEPAVAALSGFMILGERLSFLEWVAISCVIAASLGASIGASIGASPASASSETAGSEG